MPLFILVAACNQPRVETIPEPAEVARVEPTLQPGNWYPANRAALEERIAVWAERSDEEALVAVFDWDNTATCGDIGETTFYYQLEQLAFRLTPEELADVMFPESISGITHLANGTALADVRADLLGAYDVLWPLVQAGDLDGARSLDEYHDFRAKVLWYYHEMRGTEEIGPTIALYWLVFWLSHLSEQDVHDLVARVVADEQYQQVARRSWTAKTSGRIGTVAVEFTSGLCPQPEMKDFMTVMKSNGIQLFVVSASHELLVEAVAAQLGYPVGPDHIFGVRARMVDGVIVPRAPDPEQYPLTYRPGKVAVIERFMPAHPVFVAGDADTDFEMLTGFDSLELRLLINRNKQGDIRTLYGKAFEEAEDGPKTLLQGRDENECRFHPLQETTRLGDDQPAPL